MGTTTINNPMTGDCFYDISICALKVYTGTEWVVASECPVEELIWAECCNIEFQKAQGTYEQR